MSRIELCYEIYKIDDFSQWPCEYYEIYISLPSLHDYDVKMPNFTMYRGSTQATTKFPLSFWTWLWFWGIQLWEGSPTFDKVTWSNRDKDWKNANSLFQRRFHCRRRPRILRSLITQLKEKVRVDSAITFVAEAAATSANSNNSAWNDETVSRSLQYLSDEYDDLSASNSVNAQC